MIYLIGWTLIFTVLTLSELTGNRSRSPLFILLIFFTMISVLRGDVGTDTNTYEFLVSGLYNGTDTGGMEPGFIGVSEVLLGVFDSPVMVVRFFALIFFGLLYFYVARSNKNERFLFLAYIAPAFIYQYSMNVIRLGIASGLLILAAQYFNRSRIKSSAAFAVGSVLFHYSIMCSFAIIWLSQMRWSRFSTVFAGLFFFALAMAVVYLNMDYFQLKLASYQGFSAPGESSGLSKLVVLVILVFGILFSGLQRADKTKLSALGAGLGSLFWMLSAYTYAGLRFLDLLSFALPVAVLITHNRRQINFNLAIKICLVLSGMLGAVSAFKNFLSEEGVGPSPFLPYTVNLIFELI
ncbi:EpsG family protein [Pseudomonas sp. SJZ131]|uniref:EpsG family protein n=1 Tax=Pseudomonas sp. SJZ131 TaxID=2572895 RepID=UPI001199A14D|nr:EpsG family protein [Pseudomonas sp. SJZ131]TWD44500.1 EpsG-like putative glucosyltransferase [Pseudomonas sp. SJZ131]